MYTYMYTDLHVPQLFDFHSLVRVHVDGLEELLHRGARGVLQDLLGRDEAAGVGVDLPEEPSRLQDAAAQVQVLRLQVKARGEHSSIAICSMSYRSILASYSIVYSAI